MSLIQQVLLGTLAFGICAVLHLAVISYGISFLGRLSAWTEKRSPNTRAAIVLGAAFGTIVTTHTLQIWFWAALLLIFGAFSDIGASFYFSVVSYTTLGFGDIVLQEGLRVFGAFAAVTGVLTLGVSTAFLLGVIVRVMPNTFGAP